MATLIITDMKREFEVSYKESISLELALNRTEYGTPWKDIGDDLFNFGTKRTNMRILIVKEFQYTYLYDLHCRINLKEQS
jgi:hypothetical protein